MPCFATDLLEVSWCVTADATPVLSGLHSRSTRCRLQSSPRSSLEVSICVDAVSRRNPWSLSQIALHASRQWLHSLLVWESFRRYLDVVLTAYLPSFLSCLRSWHQQWARPALFNRTQLARRQAEGLRERTRVRQPVCAYLPTLNHAFGIAVQADHTKRK